MFFFERCFRQFHSVLHIGTVVARQMASLKVEGLKEPEKATRVAQ